MDKKDKIKKHYLKMLSRLTEHRLKKAENHRNKLVKLFLKEKK